MGWRWDDPQATGPAYQEPGVELTTYSLTPEQQTELERRITERDAGGLIPFLDGILGEDFGGTMFAGSYGFSTLFGDFEVNIETDPNGSKQYTCYKHHFILKGNSLYEVTLAILRCSESETRSTAFSITWTNQYHAQKWTW